jgi:hypothetical protein
MTDIGGCHPAKSATARLHVLVAVAALAGDVEALRYQEVEVIFHASHRDIEQPPFLFDFHRCASSEIRRNAAVNDIQHED